MGVKNAISSSLGANTRCRSESTVLRRMRKAAGKSTPGAAAGVLAQVDQLHQLRKVDRRAGLQQHLGQVGGGAQRGWALA